MTTAARPGVLAVLTGTSEPSAAQMAIAARLDAKTTLRGLSDAIGENPGYLSAVLAGKRPASRRLIRKLRPAWLGQAVAGLRALETARLSAIRRK